MDLISRPRPAGTLSTYADVCFIRHSDTILGQECGGATICEAYQIARDTSKKSLGRLEIRFNGHGTACGQSHETVRPEAARQFPVVVLALASVGIVVEGRAGQRERARRTLHGGASIGAMCVKRCCDDITLNGPGGLFRFPIDELSGLADILHEPTRASLVASAPASPPNKTSCKRTMPARGPSSAD